MWMLENASAGLGWFLGPFPSSACWTHAWSCGLTDQKLCYLPDLGYVICRGCGMPFSATLKHDMQDSDGTPASDTERCCVTNSFSGNLVVLQVEEELRVSTTRDLMLKIVGISFYSMHIS